MLSKHISKIFSIKKIKYNTTKQHNKAYLSPPFGITKPKNYVSNKNNNLKQDTQGRKYKDIIFHSLKRLIISSRSEYPKLKINK